MKRDNQDQFMNNTKQTNINTENNNSLPERQDETCRPEGSKLSPSSGSDISSILEKYPNFFNFTDDNQKLILLWERFYRDVNSSPFNVDDIKNKFNLIRDDISKCLGFDSFEHLKENSPRQVGF